jgi:hypothetical protein
MKTDEAVKLFQNKYFDAIMIDADHKYESVINDVMNWLPKLKDNGTLFGDDYYMESVAEGCKKGLIDYYKKGVHLAVMYGRESTWYHDKSDNPDKWLKKIP